MSLKKENPLEKERTVQRCNQVLDAAAICFRQYGFHGASMAQISKVAGMSPGHIYHYFENKEAIISAIVQRDLEQMIEWTEIFHSSDNINKIMLDTVDDGMACHLDRDSGALMLEILAESARNPAVAESVHKANDIGRERLIHLLEMEAIQRGKPLNQEQLKAKTDLMACLFEGLTIVNMNRSEPLDIKHLSAMFKQTIQFILQL